MNARLSIAILLIVAVCWAGCKKYEQGPLVSLKSKKSRLVGIWQFETNPDNNSVLWNYSGSTNSSWNGVTVEFTEDMKVIGDTTGWETWRFDDKKANLILNNGTNDKTYIILKLTDKELKLKFEIQYPASSWEYHLAKI